MVNYEKSISIICPSPKGAEMALKLAHKFDAVLYLKIKKNMFSCVEKDNDKIKTYVDVFDLKHITKEAFMRSREIIFICSTGIAVRAIASFISSKDIDPAVLVVDLTGRYVISLLSGHLGGANELTREVSDFLGAAPIITTATDNLGIIAPDIIAKNNNLVIEDLKKAKYISSLLVDKKAVFIKDDFNMISISDGYEKTEELKEDCLWITHKTNMENELLDSKKILKLIKKDIVLGIGCRKNTPFKKLKEFIKSVLKENNIDIRSVAKIATVDIKSEEKAIIELCDDLNCRMQIFTRDEIKNVHEKYEKSEFVLKTLGIYSVCEPCVELADAEIIISKIKNNGMTLAVGVIK